MRAEIIHRKSNYIYKLGFKRFSKLFDYLNYLLHASYIPGSATIGNETKFAYGGLCAVIHKDAVIGSRCMIGQGVTIGGRNGIKQLPIIENNVFIGPNVTILGNITIGHDSIIGANSLVVKNIPPYSVVAGNPGKVISVIDSESFDLKYKYYYGPQNFFDPLLNK